MKRIIMAISVLLVFGLAVAAIAYKRSSVIDTASAASCCCCSGDSCPMKKDGAANDATSCCNDDCCKDGSCAMKKGGTASSEGMPEDCPMMKDKAGHASHTSMTAEEHQAMHTDGKSCSCSCCKAKQNV